MFTTMNFHALLLLIMMLKLSSISNAIEIVGSQDVAQPGTDLTLQAGSSGADVVDACIQKMYLLPNSVFKNDFGFLKRIALVESNFGKINNHKGGIWQISNMIYNTLLNVTNSTYLTSALANISSVFGPSVADLSNSDFSVPLRSALAARLFIEIIQNNETLPQTLLQQNNWWKDNYNLQYSCAYFANIVENYEGNNRCSVSKLDLWFLLDVSGSIGLSNYSTSLEFVNQTAAEFVISPDKVRVGLTVYSWFTYTTSYLNEHLSNKNFSEVVFTTPYLGGYTRTGAAITEVLNNGFSITNGARPPSEAVPRVLVVLTDGVSSDDVIGPSEAIKENGVTVFGVIIGNKFDEAKIKEIASDPDSEYAYQFTNFEELSSVLKQRIATQVCEVPAVIPTGTSVSITVAASSTFYGELLLPANGSIELQFNLSPGARLVAYVSSLVTNPNSAYADGSFVLSKSSETVYINSPEKTDPRQMTQIKNDEGLLFFGIYMAVESQNDVPVKIDMEIQNRNFRTASSAGSIPSSCNSLKRYSRKFWYFYVLLLFLLGII